MSKSIQPEVGFVEVNGTQLYYETLGEGHPLALIHGGYMDRRMWDDQFHAFAKQYRVEKTYLLGLSLGGMIALDFTLDYPKMVDALILVGSPVPGFPIKLLYTEEQLEQLQSRWAAFKKASQERDLPAMVDALMEDPTLVPSRNYPAARQRVRNNLLEYSFVWVLDPAPKQDLEPPAYERLSEIHTPTLIIMGAKDDPRLFKDADKLEKDIAGSSRVTIAETHHMPNMERPEEFNTIVLDFLAGPVNALLTREKREEEGEQEPHQDERRSDDEQRRPETNHHDAGA